MSGKKVLALIWWDGSNWAGFILGRAGYPHLKTSIPRHPTKRDLLNYLKGLGATHYRQRTPIDCGSLEEFEINDDG